MIDKEQAKSKGLNILETRDHATKEHFTLIDKLKALIPNIVNSDNMLDMSALEDLIDLSETTANNKGYELTFAGKGLAKAQSEIPTEFDLKVEQGQSKNFEETDNVVIRGDNLDVLKILRQNYTNKIKMIYIDPPYNTKSENFVYKDNFKSSDEELIQEFGLGEETKNYLHNVYGTRSHSGWLSFMYPRLRIARELLREDGVIFISIDDNEQANLKILCDELFGEDNFVGMIDVISTPGGKQASKNLSIMNDYVLIYSKSDEFQLKGLKLSDEQIKKYNKSDEHGNYLTERLRQHGIAERREDVPTLYFPIYYNELTKDISMEFIKDCVEVLPILPNGEDGRWIWSKDKIIKDKHRVEIRQVKRNNKLVYDAFFKKYLTDDLKSKPSNLWNETQFRTEVGSKYVTTLFGEKVFSFPKPLTLIKRMLEIATDENDIVLDFFAGSGTTGDAVMQLNAEDGGNRRFILAQWDENIDESKPAYKFCIDNGLEPVISSITIERLNRAGEKIAKGDTGYKVFSLQDKRKVVDKDGTLTVANVGTYTTLDKLYNLLSASSQVLNSVIEVVEENKLYKINNAYYVLDNFTTSLDTLKGHKIFIDGYSSLSLENALNLDIVDNENVSVVY